MHICTTREVVPTVFPLLLLGGMRLAAPVVWGLMGTGCPVDPDDDDSAGDDDDVPAFDPDLADALDATLEELRDKWDAPGIAAAVRLPDGATWTGAVGTADLDAGEAMSPEQPTKIASVTKTFTATVILQLVGEGVVGLDDPLEDWVPGVPGGDEIAIRHLLEHSSGIPDYTTTLGYAYGAENPWTDEELVALVDGEERLFEPGAAYSYSNTNYVLLGMVILAATGDPWRDQVDDRLLEPMGLEQTDSPSDDWGDIIPGYLGTSDQTDAVHATAFGAAGCMTSTVVDQVVWASSSLGVDLLEPAEQDARTADPLVIGGPFSYGLGVLLRDLEEGTEIAHNGALPGYVAWTGYLPDRGIGLAMTANTWAIDPDSGQYSIDWSVPVSEALWEVVLGL